MPPKVVAGCLLLPTLLVAAALLACPRGATAQGVEVTYEGRKNREGAGSPHGSCGGA